MFGRVVAPGAMYGSMASTAASLCAGPEHAAGRVTLTDMRFHVPLVLPEGAEEGGEPGRTVQVVLGAGDGPKPRSVEIYSRGEDESGWTLHAEVWAGVGASEAAGGADLDALKEGLWERDAAGFYRWFAGAGVALGPSFHVIRSLWAGAGEVVGEVSLSAELSEPGVIVHPVLLDGCFQVLMQAMKERAEDRADGEGEATPSYLPFGWERLWLRGALPERVTCHARLREPAGGASAEVVAADLWLYEEDGTEVGGVSGLVLKRATRAAFMAVAGGLRDLLYAPVWRAGEFTGGLRRPEYLPSPEAAVAEAGGVAGHLSAEGLTAERTGALAEELERASRGYAVRGLDELGWEREPGEEVAEDDLRRRLKVVTEHARLFGRVLGLAADAGVLERAGEGGDGVPIWRVLPGAGEAVEPGGGAAEGTGGVEMGLLSRCGGSLAEVLRGRVEPLALLFDDEGGVSAAELYGSAPTARALNGLLSGVLGAAVSGLPAGGVVRVLEVGAGTGGSTGAVLSRLPAGRFEYDYTDVSTGFFAGARERFAGVAGLRYGVLDIEREPAGQGYAAHGYDVVVAANVLHATRDMRETLAHCRGLLAPGGLLVMLEGLRGQGWLDLTFGMLEGWWRFAEGGDGYRGAAGPLMGAGEWRRALADAGFEEAVVLGEEEGMAQGVVVARGPAELEEPPGLWVVALDEGGAGLALAEELARRNQRVVAAVDAGAAGPGETEVPGVEVAWVDVMSREGWRGLLERVGGEGGLRGVVHLGAMSGHGSGAGAAELAGDVERGTGSALALVQGLLDAGLEPSGGLWLVTRGAQVVEGERAGELSGAALWGLGKTVALEAGGLRPRMVDLDPAEGTGFGLLVEELLYPDREGEVAYRGGSRRVLRLVQSGAERALPEGTDWRLVSGADGSLESVRAARPPVEVREDGTYLVTGGLGGIGLEVAGWLAERGARSIVLNGRREPEEAALAAVEALRERGVDVGVELADVSDGGAVADMLARMDRELPPLAGVFHSVGVLSDAALGNQDWGRFEQVMWPKVLGAWHLHRATEGRDLDLFVLFTSTAGVLGNAGQANHAAANAFLDQLARHRRALGLAGQSIAWGAWSGVGEAEEQRARMSGAVGWMTPRQGIGVLERVVRGGESTVMAAVVDWEKYAAGVREAPALVEECVRLAAVDGGTDRGGGTVLERLRQVRESGRESLLVEFVQREAQAVLQTSALPAAGVGFFDLGMDSLMAMELRNRLNRGLGGWQGVVEHGGVRSRESGGVGAPSCQGVGVPDGAGDAAGGASRGRRGRGHRHRRAGVPLSRRRRRGGVLAPAGVGRGRGDGGAGESPGRGVRGGNGRGAVDPVGRLRRGSGSFRRGVLPHRAGGGAAAGPATAVVAGDELGGAGVRRDRRRGSQGEPDGSVRGDLDQRLPGGGAVGGIGERVPAHREQRRHGHRPGGVHAGPGGSGAGGGHGVLVVSGGGTPGGDGSAAR